MGVTGSIESMGREGFHLCCSLMKQSHKILPPNITEQTQKEQ